jgi:hypothetical protein
MIPPRENGGRTVRRVAGRGWGALWALSLAALAAAQTGLVQNPAAGPGMKTGATKAEVAVYTVLGAYRNYYAEYAPLSSTTIAPGTSGAYGVRMAFDSNMPGFRHCRICRGRKEIPDTSGWPPCSFRLTKCAIRRRKTTAASDAESLCPSGRTTIEGHHQGILRAADELQHEQAGGLEDGPAGRRGRRFRPEAIGPSGGRRGLGLRKGQHPHQGADAGTPRPRGTGQRFPLRPSHVREIHRHHLRQIKTSLRTVF